MKSLDQIFIESAGAQAYEKMGNTSQSQAFSKRETQLAGTGQKAKQYNIEQVKAYVLKLKELKLPKQLILKAVNEVYGS